MYAGQKMLLPGESMAYDIGLDFVKYKCTPDSDLDQETSLRSDPRPSPPIHRSNQKPSDWVGLSQSQDIQEEEAELIQEEIDDMANALIHTIKWMEIAKTSYKHIGKIVLDVCKALGNVDIQDINTA